jgi:sortase A
MKWARKALAAVSLLLISLGVVTAGYAGVQIYQMNSNDEQLYLPKSELIDSSSSLLQVTSPELGEVIGTLWSPKLKKRIDIVEGTDPKQLKFGVGHYRKSVLPGFSDNSVLAGHRDSVFRNLGSLKLGDLISVQMNYGEFVYKVHKIRIVKANDRTVIVPSDVAILTLSTCFPFRFIGNAPDRYIVQAELVNGEPIG